MTRQPLKRHRRHRWTDAHSERLRILVSQGMTVHEMAAAMAFSYSAVLRRVRAAELTLASDASPWTPKMDADLAARYSSETASSIAKTIGVTEDQLYRRVERLGIFKTATATARRREALKATIKAEEARLRAETEAAAKASAVNALRRSHRIAMRRHVASGYDYSVRRRA